MKKTTLAVSIAFFLSVFIAGPLGLTEGAEPKTFRGKTAQGDAFYVELEILANKKAHFLLTFTEMSEKMTAFFSELGKSVKDPEMALNFLNGNDSVVAKVRCPLEQFKLGAGGGLQYQGEIPGDPASRTASVSVQYPASQKKS